MSPPGVRVRIPLGAGLSEIYRVSPPSILQHCFYVVSLERHFSLTCLT